MTEKKLFMEIKKMNRVKKKAILDFCSACLVTVLVISVSISLRFTDADRIKIPQIIVSGVIPGGIMAYYGVKNKRQNHNPMYDERELLLIKQAYEWFTVTFISYILVFTLIVLTAFGGRGTLPIWSLPVVLFSGLFLSQCVASFYLLRCTKETDE